MKKRLLAVLATGAALTMSLGLAACGDKGDYVTVTYMDGTTVLKTEKVEKGTAPKGYTPEKDGGYDFVAWYATPSKNHKYDMSAAITEDIKIYAGFSKYEADTRDFYIIGAGTSSVLIDGWGNINEAHKFTKTEGKNEYKLTLDLLKGDEFVIVAGVEYESKRGAGYLETSKLADGTEVFGGAGSVYDDSAKGKNISVLYSGNYTLTLNTYPGDDYYNEKGEGYTEDRKEIYRMGTYDNIQWVRNSDPLVTKVTVTDYYIKGSGISNWKDQINTAHLMKRDGKNYSLSVYLKEGEQFMFASQNTISDSTGTTTASGSSYIKSNNLDETSRTLLDGYSTTGGNMTAKASGMYTFNYNEDTKVLNVTFKAEAETQYDYYLDGKHGTINWESDKLGAYKLTGENGVYKITAELKANDIIAVRSYKVGAELVSGYTGYVAIYGSKFTILSSNFSADGDNIKVVTAGTYEISFDNYSKMLTIVDVNADPNDIYIKGGMNGWEHGFSKDFRLTRNAENNNLYEITLDFQANWELGLARYDAGVTTGSGDWIGSDKLGTSGDANDKFAVPSGNLKCNTAGKYKVVYNIETQKLDFYAVA